MYGKPEENYDLADFILSKIENRKLIDEGIKNAADGTVEIVKNGIDKAMNKFN